MTDTRLMRERRENAENLPDEPHNPESRCAKCGHRFRNHHSTSLKCPTIDKHLVSGWIDGSYWTEREK